MKVCWISAAPSYLSQGFLRLCVSASFDAPGRVFFVSDRTERLAHRPCLNVPSMFSCAHGTNRPHQPPHSDHRRRSPIGSRVGAGRTNSAYGTHAGGSGHRVGACGGGGWRRDTTRISGSAEARVVEPFRVTEEREWELTGQRNLAIWRL